MTNKRTIIAALTKLTSAEIELVRGQGYWYFAYTTRNPETGKVAVYETHSVYCMYLNAMTDDRWIAEGAEFIRKMENAA